MTKISFQKKFQKEFVAIIILIFAALLFFIQVAQKNLFYDFYGNVIPIVLCVLFLLAYHLQKKSAYYKRKYLEIESLTNNMSGGIVTYALDSKLSILHANDGYYNLIGYSRQEVSEQFNNSGLSFMGASELLQQLDPQRQLDITEKTITLEFPLKKGDGSIIWIRSNCKRTCNTIKGDTISYLMIDITDAKVNEQALLLEKERYHIATELTNDIIFEYDIASDLLTHTAKYQQIFGRPSLIPRFVQNIDEVTWVSPSTLAALKNLCHDFRSGKPIMSAELKLMDSNQAYTWCHIKGQTIYDEAGIPHKIIGKIVNIDAQKKALEELYSKACRDPLTGLYNKTVTKTLIDKTIHDAQREDTHVFMIIDIDNFKTINDGLGHLVGDEVLTTTAEQLQRLQRKDDIVGRIGGDEFVVFLRNIRSTNDALKKAASISHALCRSYQSEEKEYSVSGSIGISFFPSDGKNYNELLVKADTALYKIKKHGKNNFAIASSPERVAL